MPMSRRPPEPEEERYRPVSWRRRLLILVLAVATATTIVLSLVGKPGGASHQLPPSVPAPLAGPAVCADGKGSDCIGGMATVIVPVREALAASATP
jgi:hypothetical protein